MAPPSGRDRRGSVCRLWVTFVHARTGPLGDTLTDPVGFALLHGCGVTGFDAQDALDRMHAELFEARPMPDIDSVTLDVDISTLDSDNVLPFIGNPTTLGVWFPKVRR
jgi:hypothetical protein